MSVSVNLETSASYQAAGVRFSFSLVSPQEQGQAQLTVSVDDLATGKRLDFSHQACPAVHDFTRGFARWLGTRGFQATRNDDEIVAMARTDLTVGNQQKWDTFVKERSRGYGSIVGLPALPVVALTPL